MHKSAVFLDRDGVINRKMPEGQYVLKSADFVFLPGVFDAIKILKSVGFLIIITTNQRCIAKKLIIESDLQLVHERMMQKIRDHGGDIDALYYCPHEITEGCTCRKPQPGMIFQAIQDYKRGGIELTMPDSYMIGDSDSDILAGRAAGLRTIKIGTASANADFTSENLNDAVQFIVANGASSGLPARKINTT